jgi:hypothetical protein
VTTNDSGAWHDKLQRDEEASEKARREAGRKEGNR